MRRHSAIAAFVTVLAVSACGGSDGDADAGGSASAANGGVASTIDAAVTEQTDAAVDEEADAADTATATAPATTAAPATQPATSSSSRAAVADSSGAVSLGSATDTHPTVIGVNVTSEGDRAYSFAVTISSPYDSPERYADAWRVVGPDGEQLGLRMLTHDHANEQPFTRSQSGIVVPAGIDTVTIEGRDLVNGWGGRTFTVAVPG